MYTVSLSKHSRNLEDPYIGCAAIESESSRYGHIDSTCVDASGNAGDWEAPPPANASVVSLIFPTPGQAANVSLPPAVAFAAAAVYAAPMSSTAVLKSVEVVPPTRSAAYSFPGAIT